MQNKGYFITGTDTNVGKTVAAAWLVHHLKADYWKPIQSGSSQGTDTKDVCRLTQLPPHRVHPEAYCLKAPLSPHVAAALEHIDIDLAQIKRPVTNNCLIIEGAGGVFVPINKHETMLDLMEKCGLPVIIVSANRLGTINHTCMTIAALRQRGLEIAGVILNENAADQEDPSLQTNREAIEHYGQVKVIATLKRLEPLCHEALATYPLTGGI